MITEKQIEESLIKKLQDLKYTYRNEIRDKTALEENFKAHFERLNKVKLTDSEFARLRDNIVTSDVFTASRTLREINTFMREDGTPLQYTLVNIKDWCKNEFEVIHQLKMNTEYSHHRYDVILLINGVPVVQIELKTLHITPKRAMEQIVDYKNDPGNGYTNSMLCFMQLFIVSNESNTYYFANNHKDHFSFNADERFLPIYQLADEANKKIAHLHTFAETFLPKCTLGQMISRYMVLVASEQKLMIMRPYQIYAVKAIVDCIHQNRGSGYIWHTTGSGKTLTSFKASTLLKDNPDIEKCLFVVDRKDLDRQTREEFNKFQEGCVEENTNTETLVPKSAADFAFLLHGFHFLSDEGTMAIILPHGVLFRGGAEERIRTKLLKDGNIDTVIGLPANLFFSTGIPVCILVLKKCKKFDDVLIINASEHFEKGKRQNVLSEKHIDTIVDTYQNRKEAERYSRKVSMKEIEKNEYNLNISRYVSTAVSEEMIDIQKVNMELNEIEKKIRNAKDTHNKFLQELGLNKLP